MGTIAQKWREEGRLEGRQEGMKKAMLTNIQQALSIRFAIKRKVYEPKLKGLSLLKLKQLHKSVLTVSSLAEFETKLQQLVITKPVVASSPSLTPKIVATSTSM